MRWPWKILREAGIVGMNERNGRYISIYNPRRLYPLVDDKLITKQLAIDAGIAVPPLYYEISIEHEIHGLAEALQQYQSFVVKPAKGAGGDGIVVITGRHGEDFVRSSGSRMSFAELAHHMSNILSGAFSLGGLPDRAMVEYCVQFDPVFAAVSFQGVPDIRTIVFRGIPVAAMLRLPTRASDGKANLHQGAVGVGIDLVTGRTLKGVMNSAPVTHHPDTLHSLAHFQVPQWPKVLQLAAQCYDLARLGYLGVDVVLDRDKGPLVLELNARPGLAIQLANGRGLGPTLEKISAMKNLPDAAHERVALALELAAQSNGKAVPGIASTTVEAVQSIPDTASSSVASAQQIDTPILSISPTSEADTLSNQIAELPATEPLSDTTEAPDGTKRLAASEAKDE